MTSEETDESTSEDFNPFAAPIDDALVEVESRQTTAWIPTPIPFYGQLDESDYVSEISGDWRVVVVSVVRQHAWSLLGILGVALIAQRLWVGDRVAGFLFLLVAMAFMSSWQWIVGKLAIRWPGEGADVRDSSMQRDSFAGFLDDWGICCVSDTQAIHVPWEELSSVTLDPEAIRCVIRREMNAVQLPCRFFHRDSDYQHARQLVHSSLWMHGNEPMPGDLQGLAFPGSAQMSQADMEHASQWNETEWPFERLSDETIEFEFVAGGTKPFFRKLSDLLLISFRCWISIFPIIVAIGIWLACDRSYFGDWSFTASFGGLICIVGASILALMYLYENVREYHAWAELRGQPIEMWLDDVGYSFRQGTYRCWSKWPVSMSAVSDAESIGWQVDDWQLQIPRAEITLETAAEIESLLEQLDRG
ncbi:MAG: hypothetical protein AB8B91_15245 [Rubripirellula sp.]